jgi:hypothetical protein
MGVPRIKHQDQYGYEVLYGTGKISGKLLGGCFESLYETLTGGPYPEQKEICETYHLFPENEK